MIPAESQSSARLDLPYLQAGQMQKHVTLNEALTRLDALVQCAAVSRSMSDQPATADEGALYILPDGAEGAAWSGMAPGTLVRFEAGAWRAVVAAPGTRVFILDEQRLAVLGDDDWTDVGGEAERLDDLQGLGVGTASDETNPFAAKLNNALWTARATDEGGTGDLRYVLNKQDGAKVLSLLFQSGWSGRAEIGLVGDDDLVLKVSSDGATWREALRVDRHSGRVGFPAMDALLRPETQDILAAFDVLPGRIRTFLIDDLVGTLAEAGVWDRLDALYVMAAHHEQAARINLKRPGRHTLTATGDPAFTIDRGFQGDGAAAWLDAGVPLSALGGFTLDDATMFSWSLTDEELPSVGDVGAASGNQSAVVSRSGGALCGGANSGLIAFGAVPTSLGLSGWSREAADVVVGYRDGVAIATSSAAPTEIAAGNLAVLRRGGFHSPRQIAVAGAGRALTAQQHVALHSALAAYLTATGAV